MADSRENFKKRGEKIKKIQNVKQIIELCNFELANKKIKEFLSEYGEDIEILYHYGKLLRKTGNIEASINTFKYILEIQEKHQSNSFIDCTKKELFKVYYINDYYEEAYKLFPQIKCYFEEDNGEKNEVITAELIEKILEIKLGIYHGDFINDGPVVQKLLCYNEVLALDHIKRHLYPENNCVHSIFNGFDIDNLYELVKKILPESKKRQLMSVHDVYLFYFPSIGVNSEQLMVVTNKGTYEIITMYPVDDSLKGIINYNLYNAYLEQQPSKVKKISQIDKFNNRYNKNR